MKNKIKTFVFCGLFFLCPFLMPNLLLAQPVIDQSFTSPHNASVFINECCTFVAQTFTAGVSGTLDGVNIDVASNNNTYPLHVAINTVTISGEPSSTILGDTTLSPNSAPPSLLITFPQLINIAAGVQYAIVVNYQGAPSADVGQTQGAWYGAAGNYNYYPGGDVYGSVDGSSWFSFSEGFYADVHFQTYVSVPITLIELTSFTATPLHKEVIINWSTESEIDNAGFNIYRLKAEDGEYIKINTALIPAQGSITQGAFYEFVDTNVQNRKTYYYKLEDMDLNGISTMHEPVNATPRLIYGMGK